SFFFSSRRRHTSFSRDWSSDVCSSDLTALTYLPTGERVASLARLAELREVDPGGLSIIEFLDPDRPEDLRLLLASVTLPGGVIEIGRASCRERGRSGGGGAAGRERRDS